MTPETDLKRLLAGMRPRLQPGEYVFCALPPGRPVPANLAPVGQFLETEGLTLILRREEARTAGLDAWGPFRMISLEVHSSLEAIGFLAAVATRLAEAGIAANAVSAFHHDHLFVPAGRAEEALVLLHELERASSSR